MGFERGWNLTRKSSGFLVEEEEEEEKEKKI